jgi:hypothetical protein
LLGRKAFPSPGSAAECASERAPAGKESATGIFADVASVTPIAVDDTSVFAGVASTPDIGALGSVAANKGSDFVGADVVFEATLMPAAEAGAEATVVFAVEDAFAFEIEAGAVEFEAEAGVDAGEARPRSSAAKADDPNNANSMAATATLTSLPLGVGANARALSN